MESLRADILLLLSNCEMYNVDGAPINLQAKELVDKLLTIVNTPDIETTAVEEISPPIEEPAFLEHEENDLDVPQEPNVISIEGRR